MGGNKTISVRAVLTVVHSGDVTGQRYMNEILASFAPVIRSNSASKIIMAFA